MLKKSLKKSLFGNPIGLGPGLGDNILMPPWAWIFIGGLILFFSSPRGRSQETQWQSLAGEASAMSRKISPESMDYNLDLGPVLLNVGASLTGGYNSNTGLSETASGGSAYATPAGTISLAWPITDLNMLICHV